jgi:hypothetical protein
MAIYDSRRVAGSGGRRLGFSPAQFTIKVLVG